MKTTNSILSVLLSLLLPLLLASCSLFFPSASPRVALDSETQINLPVSSGVKLFYQQLIQFQPSGAVPPVTSQPMSFTLVIDADGCRLRLAGFSLWGARLFDVQYVNPQLAGCAGTLGEPMLQIEKLPSPQTLPPLEPLLANVMLAYWPREAWQQQLPTGWLVQDVGKQRRLMDGAGRLRSEITYRNAIAHSPATALTGIFLDWQVLIQTSVNCSNNSVEAECGQ